MLPSSVVTVIVAVPTLLPVTTPSFVTEAIVSSLLDQETFLLSAVAGETVGVNVWV